jgi:hypothetical protein
MGSSLYTETGELWTPFHIRISEHTKSVIAITSDIFLALVAVLPIVVVIGLVH